ncbi:hypothetical protein K501DRAFT_327820 [Backusella circina FSU 941]|nr:hypothetical protein K501DRAFT_327820 [Backusella circina FSU 941]
MFGWKALRRKKSPPKNKKTRPLSTQASASPLNGEDKYAVKRAFTAESTSNWTVNSQTLTPKDNQGSQPQPNDQLHKILPNSLPQEDSEPSQSKNHVVDKYNELLKEIGDIKSYLHADKEEILKSLEQLNPINVTDEIDIDKDANSTEKMLDTLISRTAGNIQIDLNDRKKERDKIEKEFEAGKAHLKELHEAMDSTRKDFQDPKYEHRTKALLCDLNEIFANMLKKYPKKKRQLTMDYNSVIKLIIDKDAICETCKEVQRDSKNIQEKIQSKDTTWADNFNKKISISLTKVNHKYNTSQIVNISYIPNNLVEELHKLYSGYKDKTDIYNYFLRPINWQNPPQNLHQKPMPTLPPEPPSRQQIPSKENGRSVLRFFVKNTQKKEQMNSIAKPK